MLKLLPSRPKLLRGLGTTLSCALLASTIVPLTGAASAEASTTSAVAPATTQSTGADNQAERTVIEAGGTAALPFEPEIPLQEGFIPCNFLMTPWVLLTNEETGEQFWGEDPGLTTRTRFPGFELRYPGGDLTLSVYEKTLNDADCYDRTPPEDISNLNHLSTERFTVDWEKPEIVDISNVDGGQVVVTASPRWDLTLAPNQGGPATYLITNYGNPEKQQVKPYSNPCTRPPGTPRNECVITIPLNDGEAIGFAALPSNIPHQASTEWPQDEFISHTIWTNDQLGPRDDPAMTRAGRSESAQCSRICTGDPIDTFTGNFFESQTDLSLPGRIGIDVTRHYAVGTLGTVGAFGDGWALNYDMRIDPHYTWNQEAVVEPSGNITPFSRMTGDPATPTVRADLTKIRTGWEFKRWGEDVTYIFNSSGTLTTIRDDNGNEVAITHAQGRVSRVAEGSRYVDFSWENNRLRSITDHTGRTVSYDYNSVGQLETRTTADDRTSHYEYDEQNRVTRMIFEDGSSAENVYDRSDRIIEQTLPSGQVIKLSYGTPTHRGRQIVNTETSGDVVKSYTYIDGRIARYTNSANPNENFRNTYNRNGLLYIEEFSDGSPQRTSVYDQNRNLEYVSEAGRGRVARYAYDDQRRVTMYEDSRKIKTHIDYDEKGNISSYEIEPSDGSPSRITSFEHNSKGDIVRVTNPLGGVEEMTYSNDGDLLTVAASNGEQTVYEYDALGRVLKEAGHGSETTYVHDDADNVVKVIDHTGTTEYTYDPLGQPASMTDPRGKTKSAEYDGAGNLVKTTAPDGSVDQFTYDVDSGDRTSWTDPQGLTTRYEYGPREVTTINPDGTQSTMKRTIEGTTVSTFLTDAEHPNGALIHRTSPRQDAIMANGQGLTHSVARNTAGQVTGESQQRTGVVSYSYNGFGELVAQSGDERNVEYDYDALGNITKITYPDGTSVSRTFDENGRLQSITDWNGETYSYEYNRAGQNTEMRSSTGLGYRQSFEGPQITEKIWSQNDQILSRFENDYLDGGLLGSDAKNEETRDFDWSDNSALAGVNDTSVEWDARLLTAFEGKELSYDDYGRLSTLTDGSDITAYTYDSRGNRLGAGDDNYSWNSLSQLTDFNDTSYGYSANGIRNRVNDNAQVYDQGLKLLSDGETKYLWGPSGELLAQAELGADGTSQQAITDTMGSVYAVVEGGEIIAEYSYSVFGERELISGENITSIGFVSEQHDDSGLIYLRYRYYDPAAGQFISVDPLVALTLDPYGYASGNPLQMIDPLGLWTWSDTATVLGAVGLGLTIGALVVGTGGVAGGLLIAASAAGMAGTAITGASAGVSCYNDYGSPECRWGLAGTAAGIIPGLGFASKLGKDAIRPIAAKSEDIIEWGAENATRMGKRFAVGGLNAMGPAVDFLDRYCN